MIKTYCIFTFIKTATHSIIVKKASKALKIQDILKQWRIQIPIFLKVMIDLAKEDKYYKIILLNYLIKIQNI